MYERNRAIDQAFFPPDRLVFSSPAGGFTIVDKTGLIRLVLAALDADAPLEPVFEIIPQPEDRGRVQERIVSMLLDRRIILPKVATQRDKGRDKGRDTQPDQTSEDILCAWLRFVGVQNERVPMIGVLGEGQVKAAVQRDLASLGLERCELLPEQVNGRARDIDLLVFCQDREDESARRAVNRLAVEACVPWFPVAVHRHVISTGPIIIPGATACVECIYHRGQMNLQAFETGAAGADVQAGAHGVSTSAFVARMAAMFGVEEIARYLFGAVYDLHLATLTRYSVTTGQQTKSVALKVPRCPVCGPHRGVVPLRDTYTLYDETVLEAAE